MTYQFNDGGRVEAGFKGKAGDCVVRAVAIVTGSDYKTMYNRMASASKERGEAKSARDGVHKSIYEAILKEFGFVWQSAPKFVGRKARTYDMPKGAVVARQAHHLVAVIDGVAHDSWDSTDKMVYGYYAKI